MTDKRKMLLAACVLYGLTALACIVWCVSTLRHGQLSFLQFLCAVLWVVSFILRVRRFRGGTDGEN